MIDLSRERGDLQNMSRANTSYIGQRRELHQAIKALSQKDEIIPLVYVDGKEHVGKKRFVQEVCYHFYCHNMFKHIIMY